MAEAHGEKSNTVALRKKTEHGWTAEMLPGRRSDGPASLIAVDASRICTSYTAKIHTSVVLVLNYSLCASKTKKIY
jgi:hypothetical protein